MHVMARDDVSHFESFSTNKKAALRAAFLPSERITSSLQLSELLREQRQPSELLQEQQRQPSELLQQELQLSEPRQVPELQLLLSCRKQPEPEPAGKRSATIFS